MIIPKPTESEKKICPAAASQVCGLASASQKPTLISSPLIKLCPIGFHIKPSPLRIDASGLFGFGVPRVSTRIRIITAQNSNAGIANLQNHSIPLFIPRYIRIKFIVKQISRNGRQPSVNSLIIRKLPLLVVSFSGITPAK